MLRVGLIGAGEWGQHLVNSVQGLSPTVLFACAATGRPERARSFAEHARLDLLPDLEAVLARPDVEAVALATPHSRHADQACRAAAAGKHVFIEKPFALTGADARRIASSCRAAGVVCAVGFNRRFQPGMQGLAALLQSGEIGDLVHLEGNFSGDTGYRYRGKSWREDRTESPLGALTATGIHVIDAFVALGGTVGAVMARNRGRIIPGADTVDILVDFESGATGYVAAVSVTAADWRVQAFCALGWAELRNPGHLTVRRIRGEPETTEFAHHDGVRAELEAFAAAVAGDQPYPVGLDEAVHGTDVMEAAILSARTGDRAAVPRLTATSA